MTDESRYKKHIDLVWTIANLLRGPYRPPQYRRVMIPLTVLRRLDCVLEDSKAKVMKQYATHKAAGKSDDETIEKIICHKFKINCFNVSGFTFAKRKEGVFAGLLDDPDNLAANLGKYIAGFSENSRRIFEKFKFEEEIEKLDDANRLFQVIQAFKGVDFHPDRVPNMAMGYIFEDLVRRFNEQANEEAGDHFTPREVISLMAHILYTYAFEASPVKLDNPLNKALLAPGALGERNPEAEICRTPKGEPEPDPELRDTENVGLPDKIALPLPLDYENKRTKGKIDKSGLLTLVQDLCGTNLAREVLPYRPDAWIDHAKIKVGYEIPFNRHFYQYTPPRPLAEIEADIQTLEKEILEMLGEVTCG